MEVDRTVELAAQCTACNTAKQHVKPFPKESHTEIKGIRDLTVSDVWGLAVGLIKLKSMSQYSIHSFIYFIHSLLLHPLLCYHHNHLSSYSVINYLISVLHNTSFLC